jgi:[acyl-carrier-protein] S-malonyltransferase
MSSRTAFVFPGQGSQHAEMIDNVPENDTFERLIDAAEALSDLPLRSICAKGEATELADTRVAQPLLYLCDWGWAISLLDSGIEPTITAGHSLGELVALSIAGVYSVEAGLELVVERSRLMGATAESTPGTMAAVLGLPHMTVRECVDEMSGVWVANENSANQVVISGTHEGVEHATAMLSEAGARRIVPLKVAGPFHSPLMEPARAAFEEILLATEFHDAVIPVVQNSDPRPTLDAATIRERLIAQITAPVRWTETMTALLADGPLTQVETGPGAVLSGLARGIEGLTALSVEHAGLEQIAEEVG